MSNEKVDFKKFFQGFVFPVEWWKAISLGLKILFILLLILIVVFGAKNIWNFFFPGPAQNVNKPRVVALPFSTIEPGSIDQRSTQILMEEKTWEAGVGVGVLQYDNRAGSFVGGWVKKKW